MSATDEELESVHDIGMDHVTYVLIMLRWIYTKSHHTSQPHVWFTASPSWFIPSCMFWSIYGGRPVAMHSPLYCQAGPQRVVMELNSTNGISVCQPQRLTRKLYPHSSPLANMTISAETVSFFTIVLPPVLQEIIVVVSLCGFLSIVTYKHLTADESLLFIAYNSVYKASKCDAIITFKIEVRRDIQREEWLKRRTSTMLWCGLN